LRHLALNLATSSVTVLVLVALAVPALRTFQHSAPAASSATPKRVFGVYVDPWHFDDWSHDVGARPQLIAKFEAFANNRTIDAFMHEAERQGVRQLLVSWEPWSPVPTARGSAAQFRPQLGYRNADIAAGWQDGYIERFARHLTEFRGIVYLRYAHEMNGSWYPWSHDSKGYVRAWRHVVRLFRRVGADNVRFVWSVNPSLYLPPKAWMRSLRLYWPGRRYVSVVGTTMINFGGEKNYTVERFAPRLHALWRLYRKPLMITEANTEFRNRVPWLRRLRRTLNRMPFVRAIAWSQLPSRGKAHLDAIGDLSWNVRGDPAASAVLRDIISDGMPISP
jgi:mannan endo-1,4-beta-mannosidase